MINYVSPSIGSHAGPVLSGYYIWEQKEYSNSGSEQGNVKFRSLFYYKNIVNAYILMYNFKMALKITW